MEIKENVLEKQKRKYNKSLPVSKGPTPDLDLPHPNRKYFTYSENKLLDQITTEVMYAWDKDLKTMRSHYRKLTKCIDLAEEFNLFLKMKLPILEKAMKESNIFEELSRFNGKIEEFQSDISKLLKLAEESNDLIEGLIVNFNSFKSKMESDVKKVLVNVENNRNINYKVYSFLTRPWWKRIFSKLDS